MTKSFETETYRIAMRNDLNLIYTMSNLISTLIKIDTAESQSLTFTAANVIGKQADELMRHLQGMYAARASVTQIDSKTV